MCCHCKESCCKCNESSFKLFIMSVLNFFKSGNIYRHNSIVKAKFYALDLDKSKNFKLISSRKQVIIDGEIIYGNYGSVPQNLRQIYRNPIANRILRRLFLLAHFFRNMIGNLKKNFE